MTARNWCATIWTATPPNLDKCPEKVTVKYLIAQREFTDDTKRTPHWQTYFECKNACRMKQALACLGLTSKEAHIEQRKGTREQARDYCTRNKPAEKRHTIDMETPIVEIGEWIPEQRGARNDLKAATRCNNLQEVREKHPETLVRYPNGLRLLFRDDTPRDRKTPLKLIIIWGPTGKGKSLYAFDQYPNAYTKPHGSWWCGYNGEDTVIWDEFDPSQCQARDFMQWFDRYPCKAPAKGDQANLRFKTAIITAHSNPKCWWGRPGETSSRYPEIVRRANEGGGHIWFTESEEWTNIITPILEKNKAEQRIDNNEWVDEVFGPFTLEDVLDEPKIIIDEEWLENMFDSK